jgi:2,3-dihydroxybenzoate-AMP ligase
MSKLLSSYPSSVELSDPGLVGYPAEVRAAYRAAGLWTGPSLPADLVSAAETHADQLALVTPETSLTYRALFDAAATFAGGLRVLTNLRAGDAVMFQLGNVAETVIAYLGSLLAGLRPVCTLPQHGEREVGVLAAHVGARGLFVQADFGRGQLPANAQSLLASGVVSEVVVFRDEPFAGALAAEAVVQAGASTELDSLPFATLDPWQVAVFQLSGGTTGLPKVAPRMHEEYAYNGRAWAERLGWSAGSVVLYALPIMHNAGINVGLQPALLSGATLVLAPSADIGTMLDLIETYRPVAVPLVPPAVAIRLIEHPRSQTVDFSCIRDFVIGGQKLSTEFATRLRDELGIAIRQKFGMAEGMFLVTPREASEAIRLHTVGVPISAADEIRILRPGTDEPVEPGEVGELCARGPYTIRGYYRAAAHNARSFTADGFYRTGDLARAQVIDGMLCYSIEGRIKDVINRGVEKIHAEEVEELILRHPGVANVALVAMPDRVLGEKACAYLIMEPGAEALDVSALAAFLTAQGLAKYKLPERVERIASFPLTNVGKVSKKNLREDIQRKLSDEAARIGRDHVDN